MYNTCIFLQQTNIWGLYFKPLNLTKTYEKQRHQNTFAQIVAATDIDFRSLLVLFWSYPITHCILKNHSWRWVIFFSWCTWSHSMASYTVKLSFCHNKQGRVGDHNPTWEPDLCPLWFGWGKISSNIKISLFFKTYHDLFMHFVLT